MERSKEKCFAIISMREPAVRIVFQAVTDTEFGRFENRFQRLFLELFKSFTDLLVQNLADIGNGWVEK